MFIQLLFSLIFLFNSAEIFSAERAIDIITNNNPHPPSAEVKSDLIKRVSMIHKNIKVARGEHGRMIVATGGIPQGTIILRERAFYLGEKHKSSLCESDSKIIEVLQYLHPENTQDHSKQIDLNVFDCRTHDGLFFIGSMFNHRCLSNVAYTYHPHTHEMLFYTLKDIRAGEELVIPYFLTTKKNNLSMKKYGFCCSCPLHDTNDSIGVREKKLRDFLAKLQLIKSNLFLHSCL